MMIGRLLALVLLFDYALSDAFEDTLGHIKPQANETTQADAAFDAIKRLIPDRAGEFSVSINFDLRYDGRDSFQITKMDDVIKITASSGVAALTGFNYYLKYYCFAHVSWEAVQLKIPEVLPFVNVTITLNDRFRYYQNVCTTSYSFVWWDWNQWEKHIDWMALNSYNLVLAFNGQEAIWKRVYNKLGLTENDINEHFTGPAFLSWLRMGNMRGFGGSLSDAWHERSIILQKKIVQRMRELGIITVLPAFAGHLPRAFKKLYPNASMTLMEDWNDFNDTYCCPYFLDPTEELFKTVGKLFVEELIQEFGTDHVYNCDSFNEVDPSTSDLTYLSNVGKSIYAAMLDADPDAIWVMQGWLFYNSGYWSDSNRVQSFITSVPLGKMIILDLQSEQFPQFDRLNSYFGQPYIWNMLHNFGGTLGMFGSAAVINENVIEARNQNGSTMIGTGLTPEGINQNYVMYEFMSEFAWRNESANLNDWFRNYTIRRYGTVNNDTIEAWQILKDTVYDFSGTQRMRGRYAITNTPSLNLNIWTWYNYADFFGAWDKLVKAGNDDENLKNNPAFLHDLVDVTRQALQINGDILYKDLISAFNGGAMEVFQPISESFIQVLYDLELILATNKDFLLGNWIKSAKACANDSKEAEVYEYNAKNQISLWGPNGEIINYANKQWSGVVSHYFQPRWQLFIDYMSSVIQWNATFNESFIRQNMFKNVEEPFTFDQTEFPTEPTGDTVEVTKVIHDRWSQTRSKLLKRKFKIKTKRHSEEDFNNDIFAYNHYLKEQPSVVLLN